MSITSKVIDYISKLEITGGDHTGEMFKMLSWESRFIRGAFGVQGDAALSVPRGNGKTALVAAIACCHLPPGPLARRRGEVVIVASSFSQGKIVFEDVSAMIDTSDRRTWRTQDSVNTATIEHRETGSRVRVIASDPRRAHGLRPLLALLDEPAQWDPSKSDKMLSALETSLGKVPGSRMIALGTRPADPFHWFSQMLETADYAQCHAALVDRDPLANSTICGANPSWGHLPSLRERVLRERDKARQSTRRLASFKALRLNLGIADTEVSPLVDVNVWRELEGEAEQRGPCFWGVDLGGSAAQSAIAGYWPLTGRLVGIAAFPSEPSLSVRGAADGVGDLWSQCGAEGFLHTVGGHSVDVGGLVRLARRMFGRPTAIAGDRWKDGELIDGLKAGGVFAPLVFRGMGYKDGSVDVRAFEKAVLDRRVIPVKSLLMRSAMSEARTVSDPAGNVKLSKGSEGGRRQRARDDVAAASVLAVAVGTRAPASVHPVGPASGLDGQCRVAMLD